MIGYEDILSSDEESDPEENDFNSNFFIKHLRFIQDVLKQLKSWACNKIFEYYTRKCFIAIDDTGYCESSLLSDLRIFSQKSHE